MDYLQTSVRATYKTGLPTRNYLFEITIYEQAGVTTIGD